MKMLDSMIKAIGLLIFSASSKSLQIVKQLTSKVSEPTELCDESLNQYSMGRGYSEVNLASVDSKREGNV